jgi:hypothetical protein
MSAFLTCQPQQRASRAVLLLVIFLMSWAAYALNAKWLAHEMSSAHTNLTPLYHDHQHDRLAAKGIQNMPGKTLPFGDAEHKLLHALSHFAQAPCAAFDALSAPSPHASFLVENFLPPPARWLEPLRRPPRA